MKNAVGGILNRMFGLDPAQTNVRTEATAGLTTFLTMAYILFVQPAVLSGAILFARRHGWPGALSGPQRDALVVLAATLALVVAAYLLYNLDFVQFQGRYLYPALIPLALLVGVGLGGWASLAERTFPALAWLPVLAMIGLGLFALVALETYIVPNLPAW